MYCFTLFSTSMQVELCSKVIPDMYYALNNPSQSGYFRKRLRMLFRFRVRHFSGLNYYFTQEITPFRRLFSVCPGFRYIGGPVQAGFTVLNYFGMIHFTLLFCCHVICKSGTHYQFVFLSSGLNVNTGSTVFMLLLYTVKPD